MGLEGVEGVIDEFDRRVDRLTRGIALEAGKRVMQKTPRDTGRAAANWNYARHAPDRSVDMEADEGDYFSKLRGLRTVVSKFKAGDTIYVTNALAYIPSLEDGHSSQAPHGMVKVTVRELQPTIDQLAREIRRGGSGT